jgi:argininosuccinate lyase
MSSMKLWGGNYSTDPDRAFWEFNQSFPFDRRLLAEEIAASQAYVKALGRCGALTADDAQRLDAGLATVLARARDDASYLALDVEDVHSFVETRLAEIVGDLAGQAHLGRSRNEQTVVALRMWIRSRIDDLRVEIGHLVGALTSLGLREAATIVPGFTHTRAAEPITLGYWACAHAWGLVRDFDRLADARARVDVMPLGSGALAGTALPLDRDAVARDLGFAALSPNGLDAVMDRDFCVEFVAACALVQGHLSRLAEDLIWFSGPEFGFFALPEAFTSGSSLMPQKKNPDALELVRGKTGRVHGDLIRLSMMLKGLPAGYQKDLQEDKEAVFDAADTVITSVVVTRGVVEGLEVRAPVTRRAASQPEMIAATLTVMLAREGLPFRKAHELVGSMVAESQASGLPFPAVAASRLDARLAQRLSQVFDPDVAVAAKAAPGGTAPEAVRRALDAARLRVGQ